MPESWIFFSIGFGLMFFYYFLCDVFPGIGRKAHPLDKPAFAFTHPKLFESLNLINTLLCITGIGLVIWQTQWWAFLWVPVLLLLANRFSFFIVGPPQTGVFVGVVFVIFGWGILAGLEWLTGGRMPDPLTLITAGVIGVSGSRLMFGKTEL